MLVGAGGKVLAADLNASAGQALAAELGATCRFVTTDVTDESSVLRALDTLQEALGPPAGVVQCAGILGASRVVGKQGPHELACSNA